AKPGREGLVYAWGGMTRPSSPLWVKETYRQRFGIETSYRQMHQARIRTSTRDPLLRLLYVGVALILRNVWAWLHWEVLSQSRRGGRPGGPGPVGLPRQLPCLPNSPPPLAPPDP